MKLFIAVSALLTGCLFLGSCGSDEDLTARQLAGRWEIDEALRNGRPTESLSGLYFRFGPEDRLVTNLNGREETGQYELEDNTVQQTGTTMDVVYQIESITDSTLTLRTQISQYDFRFDLRKVAD